MNSIVVVGNLVRSWELRYLPNGAAVAKNGLAVSHTYTNRNGEKVEQTDFLTVQCWRGLAENVAESTDKGDRVIVSGRLSTRSWETEDGAKRSVTEVEADEIGPSLRWATCVVTRIGKSGGKEEWQSEGAPA